MMGIRWAAALRRVVLHPQSGFAIRGQWISDCGWQGRTADEEDGPGDTRCWGWTPMGGGMSL